MLRVRTKASVGNICISSVGVRAGGRHHKTNAINKDRQEYEAEERERDKRGGREDHEGLIFTEWRKLALCLLAVLCY
jgi:hypothetical protein